MARKDDIRFDGRVIEVEHASARGEVVRNVGSFTRGSQLVRLRYMMLIEGLRFPIMAALTGFVGIVFLLLYFMMQDHETQLVEMRAYAGFWNLIGLNPDHVLNLTLPDDSVVPVSVTDIPDHPAVAAAWSKFWRVIFASILGAGFLTAPLTTWFIKLSRNIGTDILKERQERGASLAEEPVLRTAIVAHNQDKLAGEIAKRFAPDQREVMSLRWTAYIARMDRSIQAIRQPQYATVRRAPAPPPCLLQKLNNAAMDIVWPQVRAAEPTTLKIAKPVADNAGQQASAPQAAVPPTSVKGPVLYAPYTIANIPYPWRLEQSHAIMAGTTGTGKTTQLRNLVSEARLRGNRCVIFDITGAFVEAFYNPETDFILNPMDVRCPPWTVFNDCDNHSDFINAAKALIPMDGGGGDQFWPLAARTLFVEMCVKLAETGETTNGAIAHLLMTADLASIHKALEGTIASPLTAENVAKMAGSIRAVFNTNAQAIQYLPDPVPGGMPPFSIRRWMKEAKPGSILFATSRRTDMELSQKLITLWVDTAVNAMMEQPRTMDLNTWFLFDEVHALHRLPAIESGLQQGRNHGGAFVLGIHSFDKLCETYGREGAINLSGLARTKLILATADSNTAEECSKWIGSREVRETDEAYSIGATRSRDAATITPRTEVKPLVMLDDLMNLPQLHGYIKFPEGFPAARVELAYVDYPNIAEGFIRVTKMQAAPYIPKDQRPTTASDAGGLEPEVIDPQTGEVLPTSEQNEIVANFDNQQDQAIDSRAITSADHTPATKDDARVDELKPDTAGAPTISAVRLENLWKTDSSNPEGLNPIDPIAERTDNTNPPTIGSQQPKREQQIAIEERTGQAANDPGQDNPHHRPTSEHTAARSTPSLDRDDGMDMGV